MRKEKSYKTKTIRLCPNEQQKKELDELLRSFRFIHNYFRKKAQKDPNNIKEMIKEIRLLKRKVSFLSNIDFETAEKAVLFLDKQFRETGKLPPFLKDEEKWVYSTDNIKGNIWIRDGKIKIPGISPIQIKKEFIIPTGVSIKSIIIFKTKEKYEAGVCMEMNSQYLRYIDHVKENFGTIKPWKEDIKIKDVVKSDISLHCWEKKIRLNLLRKKLSDKAICIRNSFEVDRGHIEGPEIHCVTNNGVIFILNRDKFLKGEQGLVTILFARKKQVERLYFMCGIKPDEELLLQCKINEQNHFCHID